jgi:hypothetical protein
MATVRPPGSLRIVLDSLLEYFTALGRWGWLVLVDIGAGLTGAILDATGKAGFPMWVWLTMLIAAATVAPFVSFHRVRLQRERLRLSYDSLTSSFPNLELQRAYVDQRTVYGDVAGSRLPMAKLFCAHVKFRNNPAVRIPEATARDVVAEVSFFDAESGPALADQPIYGRWGDTAEPSSLSASEPSRELAQVTFEFNGLPRELDVAVKHPADSDCFAYNNESYSDRTWSLPKFHLQGNTFHIRLRLVGQRVDRTWRFVLRNEGAQGGLQIEPE